MRTSFGIFAWTRATSPRLTRGGPLMGTASGVNIDFRLLSSPAKKNSWLVDLSYTTDELGGWDYTIQGGLEFRPSDRWEFSVTPSYSRSVNARQYITALEGGGEATFGKRYIFSFVSRSTPSTQFRLNYALTPDLSLEIYAEPFAASGRFYDFGELSEAGSRKLRIYGSNGTTVTQEGDGVRTITAGEESFSLSNRDFNVRSFRSNAVLRWEWRLGSTLFLVWQQDRSSSEAQGDLVGPRGLWDALTVGGDNFIAVKISNWLPIH